VPGDAVVANPFGLGYSGSVISGSRLSGSGLAGVVEAAEEQGGVGDVFQGFGPVVQLRLEVLLGDRVSAQGPQRQHVLTHQPEELAGAPELVALPGEDGVAAGPFGTVIFLSS